MALRSGASTPADAAVSWFVVVERVDMLRND